MQAEDVGLGHQLIQAHQLGDGMLLEEGIEGEHLHAEGLGADRHLAGDGAGADEAQGLLEELGALQLVLEELALLHGGVGLDEARGDGHHEGHGHLGHRHAAGAGGVHGLDALLGAELLVDVVHAHAAADDQLKGWGLGEEVGVDGGLGADEEHLGLSQGGHVGADGAEGGEPLRQLGVEGVGDEDLHEITSCDFTLRAGLRPVALRSCFALKMPSG